MPQMFTAPEKAQVLSGAITAFIRDFGEAGPPPDMKRGLKQTAHVRVGDRAFAIIEVVDVRPFRPADITDMQLRDLGLETKGQFKSLLNRKFPKSQLSQGGQGWFVRFRVTERDPGDDNL